MVTIDFNKNKAVDFEIQLSGIDYSQLKGAMRLVVDGVEYGFPVEIFPDKISCNIPPLKDFLKKQLHEGDKINAKLEVYGSGFYLNPWEGSFEVKSSVTVEAKLIDVNGKNKVSAKAILSESKVEKKKVPQKVKTAKLPDGSGFFVGTVKKESEAPKEPTLPKPLTKTDITDEHIYKYMELKGTKNKSVQETIFNKAKELAHSEEKIDILRYVMDFFEKAIKK